MLTRNKVFSLTIAALLILTLAPGAPFGYAQGRPTTAAPLEPLSTPSNTEAAEAHFSAPSVPSVVRNADAENVEFVGRIGGAIGAVTVQGNYAYIVEGYGLTILGISNPASPVMVGRTSPFSDVVRAVAVVGDYAYVAAGDAGLRVVDVSSPVNPIEVGYYAPYGGIDDTWGQAGDVAAVEGYAYVAAGDAGLRIMDVSNPANPTEVGFYYNGYAAEDVAVAGNYVYVISGGLRVVDVSNPANPTAVGVYYGDDGLGDMAVAGGYVYLMEDTGYSHHWVLQIVDVTDPASPTAVGFYDTPGYACGVYVVGSTAYVVAGSGGLWVVDISDPANPTEVGSCGISGGSVAVAGDYAYVAGVKWPNYSTNGLLRVIDVSNLDCLVEIGFYHTPISVIDVAVAGDYAYIATGDLWVVDVSNPATPTEVGYCDTLWNARSHSVAVARGYVYVLEEYGNDTWLQVVQVSYPAHPTEVGYYDTLGNAEGVTVNGDYAYIASAGAGLRVMDISSPAHLTEVGAYDTWDAQGVAVAGNYAYVADGDAGLVVMDVSDPAHPTEIGAYDTWDAQGVAVAGNYTYVADGDAGLVVLDVSDPAHPTEIGACDTWNATDIAVAGDYTYIADEKSLRVIDVSDPVNPIEIGYYYTPGDVKNVTVAGDYVYVADDDGGLLILRYTGSGSTYSISGRVRDDGGDPVSGVTISAGTAGSAITDASGDYIIAGLITGTYTLTPSKAGWIFTPANHIVNVPPNATGQDFTAQLITYSISGRVLDASGNPIPGVTVSAGSGGSATTNTTGTYTITDLSADTRSLTPSKSGYTFSPSTRTVSVPPDATGQDFVILPLPVSTTVSLSGTTSISTSLTYTDTQGLPTTLDFATGVVSEVTTFVLTPTLAQGGAGFAFAGHAFNLEAFQGGSLQPNFTFNAPVTVTIHYSDDDVRVVADENQLLLRWWTGSEWQDAAQTCDPVSSYTRDVENVISVPICHLSHLGLFGPTYQIYLPLILRNY